MPDDSFDVTYDGEHVVQLSDQSTSDTAGGTRRHPGRALPAAALAAAALAVAGGSYLAAGGLGSSSRQPSDSLGAQTATVPTHAVVQSAQPGITRSRATNRQLAVIEANHLVSLMRLPTDASAPSPAAPRDILSAMRGPDQYPGTPYLVDIGRYSVIPMSVTGTETWLEDHLPAGSWSGGSGHEGSPSWSISDYTYSWSATGGVLQSEQMEVQVTGYHGGSIVRFDAQVVYVPARPAAETIPAGIDRVQIEVHGAPADKTVVVTNPEYIQNLEGIIAKMSRPTMTDQPGGPCIGAAQANETFRLSFYKGTSTVPAVVVSGTPWTVGLANISFEVGTIAEPGLGDSGGNLAAAVAHLAGIRWAAAGC
jgi:hypothetical protein